MLFALIALAALGGAGYAIKNWGRFELWRASRNLRTDIEA